MARSRIPARTAGSRASRIDCISSAVRCLGLKNRRARPPSTVSLRIALNRTMMDEGIDQQTLDRIERKREPACQWFGAARSNVINYEFELELRHRLYAEKPLNLSWTSRVGLKWTMLHPIVVRVAAALVNRVVGTGGSCLGSSD